MPTRVGRSEEAQVTVYQKHSFMLSRKAKLLIEAPVNGGRNYNGPKVAKFLVRQVLTRMNGIIIWALSRQQTR